MHTQPLASEEKRPENERRDERERERERKKSPLSGSVGYFTLYVATVFHISYVYYDGTSTILFTGREEKDVSEERKEKEGQEGEKKCCERAEKEGVDWVKDVSKTRQGEGKRRSGWLLSTLNTVYTCIAFQSPCTQCTSNTLLSSLSLSLSLSLSARCGVRVTRSLMLFPVVIQASTP